MKLLTQEIIRKLPPIKSTESVDPADIPIIVKFFTPWSNWSWFVTEAELIEEEHALDGNDQPTEDYLFFGYVKGLENELGYFVLSELESVSYHGLKIERALHFSGTLAEVTSGKKS